MRGIKTEFIFIYVHNVVELEVHPSHEKKKLNLKGLLWKYNSSIVYAYVLIWKIHDITQPSETLIMNDSKTLNAWNANVFSLCVVRDDLKAWYCKEL